MKSNYFVTVVVSSLLMLFSTCKKEISVSDDSGYIKYNPYGLTYLHDFIITNSGDLLLLGESNSSIHLIRTTNGGELLWQKKVDLISEHDENLMHSVTENSDGTILLFGSQSKTNRGGNLAVIKLNANGELINTNQFILASNDTATKGTTYSTGYFGRYLRDEDGGYFLQLMLNIGKSYSGAFEDYIIHYSNKDSIDQIMNLKTSDPSYPYGAQIQIPISNTKNSLIITNFDVINGIYLIEKFDNSDFVKGKINKKWSTEFPVINGWIEGHLDNEYYYNCNFLTNDNLDETKGVQISKLDIKTGAIVKDWLFPLQEKIRYDNTLKQNWFIASDNNSLYMPVNYDNQAYILKSSKNGTDFKTISIGGDISRDQILKIEINGEQILVFGVGTLNRHNKEILYMCRLNKNGDYIKNE